MGWWEDEDQGEPADAREMADRIEAYVRRNDWVTFAELVPRIPGSRGDLALELEGNIVMWVGMSDLFIDGLEVLRQERRVFPWPADYLSYLIDGGFLKMPIVKRKPPPRGFKKLHWLPTCLRVVESPDTDAARKRKVS